MLLLRPWQPCADSQRGRELRALRKLKRETRQAARSAGQRRVPDPVTCFATPAATSWPMTARTGLEVDIIPTQGHELAGSQAVAVGDQDGRGVPIPPPVFAGSLNELLDFPLGEVLARPDGSVNCYIYCHWGVHSRRSILIVPATFAWNCYGSTEKCNSTDVGLQTVTEGKERTSTWVKSQVGTAQGNVGFTPESGSGDEPRACPLYSKSGHVQCNWRCPLWAKSGHRRLVALIRFLPKTQTCATRRHHSFVTSASLIFFAWARTAFACSSSLSPAK